MRELITLIIDIAFIVAVVLCLNKHDKKIKRLELKHDLTKINHSCMCNGYDYKVIR